MATYSLIAHFSRLAFEQNCLFTVMVGQIEITERQGNAIYIFR